MGGAVAPTCQPHTTCFQVQLDHRKSNISFESQPSSFLPPGGLFSDLRSSSFPSRCRPFAARRPTHLLNAALPVGASSFSRVAVAPHAAITVSNSSMTLKSHKMRHRTAKRSFKRANIALRLVSKTSKRTTMGADHLSSVALSTKGRKGIRESFSEKIV